MALRFTFPPLCEVPIFGGVIALEPSHDDDRGLILWHDLSHVRAFPLVKIVSDTADELRFRDDLDREVWLRTLTLASYNSSMSSRFSGGHRFGTFAELLAAARAAAAIAV